MTQDVTGGFGPEMYLLKKAPPGRYRVFVQYFASDRNRAGVRTKVHATIIEGWGTPREKTTRKALTLDVERAIHEVATIEVVG